MKEKDKKMVRSISFKKIEKDLWDHLECQRDPSAFLKYLILKDMQDENKKEEGLC
ncbi:TPA: hypothetical protein K8N28_001121 [Clostridium perfringens]|nr:hypothetical protein [Clostridium perfringens]HBI7018488.1 hypothetical protein [Clostridium perfringens]HBI7020808.1 hypothetical protein [Clostridium perfringens]HBI7378615.1 hypothetical protein [Clostridium perfringens]